MELPGPTLGRKSKVCYQYHQAHPQFGLSRAADVGHYHYGDKHYMKPARVKMTHSLVTAYGLPNHMEVCRPEPATFKEITKYHADDYISFLSRVTPDDVDDIARNSAHFHVGESFPDCPVFEGIYEFSAISAGGSIAGAKKLNDGHCEIAINWGGGLHHAKKRQASGFCYVNDIVLAILELLKCHSRVLYIDTDVHHGDGVEEAFYLTDRVMTVSFHKFGEFFPGTGALKDTGIGKGRKYSVNIPLNDGIDDETYRFMFESVIQHVMDWYRPGAVVLQLGADSLVGDRLGAFNLSMRGHAHSVEFLKKFNVPLIMLGGGGYTIRNVARAWCYETSLAVGVPVPEELPWHEYFEYYCPEYRLDIPASNMENLNSRTYLENVRMRVVENLRSVAHAPSTQMQEVPHDDFSSEDDMLDEEEKDQRITQKMSDAYRIPDNNLSDSEDEGGGRRDRRDYSRYRSRASDSGGLVGLDGAASGTGPSKRVHRERHSRRSQNEDTRGRGGSDKMAVDGEEGWKDEDESSGLVGTPVKPVPLRFGAVVDGGSHPTLPFGSVGIAGGVNANLGLGSGMGMPTASPMGVPSSMEMHPNMLAAVGLPSTGSAQSVDGLPVYPQPNLGDAGSAEHMQE
ncbi:Histone deacetylase 2 [Borealophlyctis nickersoniae]|nr:Histone deacetylase 2 [Borealophlyctis nickersoniae]